MSPVAGGRKAAPSTPRPRKAITCRWLHSSGRFDRPQKRLRRWLYSYRLRRCSVISGTEAKGRTNALFSTRNAEEWDYAHSKGAAGECWLTWKRNTWGQLGATRAPVLSQATYRRVASYGGGETPPFRALRVRLREKRTGRTVICYVVHMPLHNTKQRAEVWEAVAEGLVELVNKDRKAYPEAEVVIVGDINYSWRNSHFRKLMVRHIAKPTGTTASWDGGRTPRKGGTIGSHGSLIDVLFTSIRIRGCRLLRDDNSSDHRPFITTLRLKQA
ncbi:MAG: hypothetical protein QM638_01310 [Nocardioides sp.]|uniref:endonuclease/exonuclease/phosphatase family protein n=1 Tax=Nocardioides sp. TaxID=35761 RepID=UPI0039E6DE1D